MQLVELARKLTLAGFLVLVPRDYAYARIVAALSVCVFLIVLPAACRPFRDPSTAATSIGINLALYFVFLSGLILFTESSLPFMLRWQLFGFTNIEPLINWLLVVNIGVTVLIVLHTTIHIRATLQKAALEPKLVVCDSGYAPNFPTLKNHKWHLLCVCTDQTR